MLHHMGYILKWLCHLVDVGETKTLKLFKVDWRRANKEFWNHPNHWDQENQAKFFQNLRIGILQLGSSKKSNFKARFVCYFCVIELQCFETMKEEKVGPRSLTNKRH